MERDALGVVGDLAVELVVYKLAPWVSICPYRCTLGLLHDFNLQSKLSISDPDYTATQNMQQTRLYSDMNHG
jgi:hypothetical protein